MARIPAPTDQEEPLADRAAARVGAQAVRRELAAALAALPARHRDVLLLVAWGGLGYEEVAQALGVPIGTVRSRLHRGRSKLREALGGSDPTTLREVSPPTPHHSPGPPAPQGRTPRPTLGRSRPRHGHRLNPLHPSANRRMRAHHAAHQDPGLRTPHRPAHPLCPVAEAPPRAAEALNGRPQAPRGRTAGTCSPPRRAERSTRPTSPAPSTRSSARPGSAASASTTSGTRPRPCSWSRASNSS